MFFFLRRYKDEIFFTWNKSNDGELHGLLQTIKEKHPNVRFQKLIGSNVTYLNAYIENRQGQLYSRVYHHPIIQSYTLPYVVGHSKLAHSNWFRSALIRAVCYCSSVEDFNQERVYLELTFLTNGYSLVFVETHIQHFFNYFHAHAMRYSIDQTMYDKFRHDCFDFITIQHKISDQLQQLDDTGRVIRLEYIYEFGPRCQFNEQFHKLWFDYFKKHPHFSKDNCQILLTTKHRYSLNALLAKENSTCSMQ